MEIDIMTLFPEAVDAMLGISILGRAQERGHIAIRTHQIRSYTTNKQMQVDDYPYGGGRGAVMQADPLYRCWAYILETHGPGRTIFMSPCGRTFDQEAAKELKARYDHLILVCGHYEGVDQRFLDECVDEELSWETLCSPAAKSPPWPLPMPCAAWFLVFCRTQNALKRNPTGTDCWNTPSTPAPPCGMTGRYRKFCSPAIMGKSPPGGKRRATSAPCAAGRTSSPNLTKVS